MDDLTITGAENINEEKAVESVDEAPLSMAKRLSDVGPILEETEEIVPDTAEPSSNENVENYLDHHEKAYLGQQQSRREQIQQWLLDKNNVPASYYNNSKRELVLLHYSDNFVRQYTQLYPGRKELLISPVNEFDVKKFISTTIRPTQLPFKEVYDYRTCASFVSEFIKYEVLG